MLGSGYLDIVYKTILDLLVTIENDAIGSCVHQYNVYHMCHSQLQGHSKIFTTGQAKVNPQASALCNQMCERLISFTMLI